MFTVLHRKHDAHEDGIWSVAWTSTNKIVTGSVDEYVKVWKVKDSKEVEEESKFEVSWGVIQVAAEKSGRYVASSSLDSKIRVWDLSKNTLSQTINASPLETWGISWNGDATKIASGSKNGHLNIWNLSTSDREQSIDTSPNGSKFLLSTCFSPNSSFLASGSIDGHVSLFSVSSSSITRSHTFESHSLPVRTVSFSHDSSTLISGSDDSLIHLYDVETGQLKGTLSGHNSWVLSVCSVGQKGLLASGGSDKMVKIWDMRSGGGSGGGCVHSFTEHEGAVWGVAYGESGHLVSVGDDKSIVIYSVVDK